MDHDLELKRVIAGIKEHRAKRVCIQLPDGLKPKAGSIKKILEAEAGVEVIIWLGSCYGACDIPLEVEILDVDMLIQWGHSDGFRMGQN